MTVESDGVRWLFAVVEDPPDEHRLCDRGARWDAVDIDRAAVSIAQARTRGGRPAWVAVAGGADRNSICRRSHLWRIGGLSHGTVGERRRVGRCAPAQLEGLCLSRWDIAQ